MMKKWLDYIAALLLGVSLTFAFAPFEIFPLAVLAPAGLLFFLLNADAKRAFWLGFTFGVGLFGSGVYWVYISIHLFGDVPNFLAVILTGGLIAILALYPAVACYLTNRYFPYNNTAKIICAFPAIWVFCEWLRSWLFTGFPWLLVGYSQTNSPLSGFAPILSVYGVSLAVIMTSGLLVNIVLNLKHMEYKSVYLNSFAVVTIWVAGGMLCLIPWTQPVGKPVSVSLVQGNVPQELKWNPEHLQLSFDRYRELTTPLWGKDKLIIWPEAAIPVPMQDAMDFITMLDNKATANNAHLIMGIPMRSPIGHGYFNSVVSLGQHKHSYVKRLLVPFGEYVPFAQLLNSVFNSMNIPLPDLLPGKMNQDPLVIGDLKILTSICYEIAFPEIVRSSDPDISMLLTVTNDAWFGESSAQAQHLQMAQMRAIEMGRPVLFVSNDGITAILGPDGRVDSAAPTHEAFVLNGNIQPTSGLTPWMLNGIDPMLFILLCLYIVSMQAKRKSAFALHTKDSIVAPVSETVLADGKNK